MATDRVLFSNSVSSTTTPVVSARVYVTTTPALETPLTRPAHSAEAVDYLMADWLSSSQSLVRQTRSDRSPAGTATCLELSHVPAS